LTTLLIARCRKTHTASLLPITNLTNKTTFFEGLKFGVDLHCTLPLALA